MNDNFAIAPDYGMPLVIAGVAVLVVFCVLLFRLERRHGNRVRVFVESRLAPRLLLGGEASKRKPLFWLSIAGCAFLLLGLAQPHWGRSMEEQTKRSHSILFVMDVSESMLAENPVPNRLERAKQKIRSLVDMNPGDRFGLIAFSGAAELMCPLTLDAGYFLTVLEAVDTDSLSVEGTDIELALELAMETFQDQQNDSTMNANESQAVVLISDGEQVEGNAITMAERAGEVARVHVVGVGDPRGTEITYTNRFGSRVQVMDGDKPHLSKLDESTLEKIALEGGGGYIRSTSSNRDIDELDGLIQQLFTNDVTGELTERLVNRYQWPLFLGILCFMLEGAWLVILPFTRKERDDYTSFESGETANG